MRTTKNSRSSDSRCPALWNATKSIASLPSLGLLTLAGLTPREHFKVEYHEIADLKKSAANCRSAF